MSLLSFLNQKVNEESEEESLPSVTFVVDARDIKDFYEKQPLPCFRNNPRISPFNVALERVLRSEGKRIRWTEIRPKSIVFLNDNPVEDHIQWDWDGWSNFGKVIYEQDPFSVCREYKLENPRIYITRKLPFRRVYVKNISSL